MSQFFARFLYSIRVAAGANVVVVNGTSYTIPIGTYYLRASLGGEVARFPAFFNAFVDATKDTGFQLSGIGWFAPPGYKYRESLEFSTTDGAFTFDLDDAAWTLPPEYLGFPSDINVQVSSVLEGGTHYIRGTRSALGAWIGGTVDGGDWTSIASHIEKEVYASTSPIYQRTKIIRMRDDRVPRMFEFTDVPGLRVQGGEVRGADIAYRETADLAAITDGFLSDGPAVALREMYRRVNGGQEFLVLYGDEDANDLTGEWEGLRLGGIALHQNFEDWYDMTRPGGEFYDVSFLGLVVAGGYDY